MAKNEEVRHEVAGRRRAQTATAKRAPPEHAPGSAVPGSDMKALEAAAVRRRSATRENAIRPAPTLSRAVAQESSGRTSGRHAASTRREANGQPAGGAREVSRAVERPRAVAADAVPESVQRHFVQVGREYFFADGARAFTDKGHRLTTPSENTQVIRDLVAIAQARGWNRIAVSGTERFRKEAWFAARSAGLTVTGYKPSAFEREHLVRAVARRQQAAPGVPPDAAGVKSAAEPSRNTVAAGSTSPRPQGERRAREHRGRLIEHGVATYRHDPHEPMSYFVKLETERGDREYWGVDFERAFRESLSQPRIGDEVVLRAVRQDPVTVKTQQREADGQLLAKEVAAHRNRWSVEKRSFLEARADAAQTLRDPAIPLKQATQQHPELLGAYLQVHAAELAAKQFRDPEDRRRFVDLVRGAVADSVARGEPMPAVRLRAREVGGKASEADTTAREKTSGRVEPAL